MALPLTHVTANNLFAGLGIILHSLRQRLAYQLVRLPQCVWSDFAARGPELSCCSNLRPPPLFGSEYD